jgi:ATP-dependent Lon protease
MPLLHRDDEFFDVPDRISVLPLRDVVLFPHVVMPLLVGRTASLLAVESASEVAGSRYVLLAAQKDAGETEPTANRVHRVGVVARILRQQVLPNGSTSILVEGIARVRVQRMSSRGGYLRATIEAMPYVSADSGSTTESGRGLRSSIHRTLSLFEEYVTLNRRIPPEVIGLAQQSDSAERQACIIAAHLGSRLEIRQRVLAEPDLRATFTLLSTAMEGEIELLGLERQLDMDVKRSLFEGQREYFLKEQLKAIKRELDGEPDDVPDEFDLLAAPFFVPGLPEAVAERGLSEVDRLRQMSPMSPEATVTRNYIEWLSSVPWTERTDDTTDVAKARLMLDEDHYGLEDVKDRILDHIAVLASVDRLDGPILCLVGPPGVGKTSLGRSVARALGRKFARISLGGVRDEAELRGHRRTYIGSMPGRVLRAMRRVGVMNPVILLDEVDKLGLDHRGDPAAALLEILDPEQNRTFSDHYLELDYDLSQVLFITTANALHTVPEPLRDRMELIRLSGYLDQEKVAIGRQFLAPRQFARNGLDPSHVELADDVIPAIINGWTREAGVRDLERRIARLSRKLVRRRMEGGTPGNETIRVTSDVLPDLLGIQPHEPDDGALDDKVGVVIGLAYTSVGGETLEVEVSVVPGRGRLQLTGTLGDVMKESASAALSYARSRASSLGLARDFHRSRDLHVHIPAGATPKDGPSAGIAIATAIISALTGSAVRGDVAMTGEVTLRGRVLPIGGLKEKAVAAHRRGIRQVIIPQGNERDVARLPEEVRTSVHFHPVRSMDDVLAIALRSAPSVTTAPRASATADVALPAIAVTH